MSNEIRCFPYRKLSSGGDTLSLMVVMKWIGLSVLQQLELSPRVRSRVRYLGTLNRYRVGQTLCADKPRLSVMQVANVMAENGGL